MKARVGLYCLVLMAGARAAMPAVAAEGGEKDWIFPGAVERERVSFDAGGTRGTCVTQIAKASMGRVILFYDEKARKLTGDPTRFDPDTNGIGVTSSDAVRYVHAPDMHNADGSARRSARACTLWIETRDYEVTLTVNEVPGEGSGAHITLLYLTRTPPQNP